MKKVKPLGSCLSGSSFMLKIVGSLGSGLTIPGRPRMTEMVKKNIRLHLFGKLCSKPLQETWRTWAVKINREGFMRVQIWDKPDLRREESIPSKEHTKRIDSWLRNKILNVQKSIHRMILIVTLQGSDNEQQCIRAVKLQIWDFQAKRHRPCNLCPPTNNATHSGWVTCIKVSKTYFRNWVFLCHTLLQKGFRAPLWIHDPLVEKTSSRIKSHDPLKNLYTRTLNSGYECPYE